MSELSREQFAGQVIEMVGRKFPLVKISRAEQHFSVRVNGHVASLENLYRMSALRPDETKQQVERWMIELLRVSEGLPDNRGSFEEVKTKIMPMIVSEDGDSSLLELSQPLVQGLAVTYGLDSDRTISYVTRQKMEAWNVAQEELHETALHNLMVRSDTMSAHAAQDDSDRIYLILFQTMDGFDASRLLLPNLHEKLREHLGSPFAAAIPNRDILLCFRNDADTIAKLRPQIETDYRQMPHQLSDKILLVTADGIAMTD